MKMVNVDIAIFGGGVAGLWLLNRLAQTQRQLSCALFETAELGGGQTIYSQGIIHGGTKYALGGEQTAATKAIAAMPALWQACLQGKGDLDLSLVPILSHHQYLFTTNKFIGKLAGFFGKLALQGTLTELDKQRYPQIFQHPKFKGLVYALNEMAIDVHALVKVLSAPQKNIFKIDPPTAQDFQFEGQSLKHMTLSAGDHKVMLKAQKFIFTAGSGNEILSKLSQPITKMQRRSLHMVIAKTHFNMPVFAHALGASTVPRITITTHPCADENGGGQGKFAWYLGGQIAEEGIHLSQNAQIDKAKKELTALFPWLSLDHANFKSFMIDRAEPLQENGKRPDNYFYQHHHNMIVAWPTKLALAPSLANSLLPDLLHLSPGQMDLTALNDFSKPNIATPLWDRP